LCLCSDGELPPKAPTFSISMYVMADNISVRSSCHIDSGMHRFAVRPCICTTTPKNRFGALLLIILIVFSSSLTLLLSHLNLPSLSIGVDQNPKKVGSRYFATGRHIYSCYSGLLVHVASNCPCLSPSSSESLSALLSPCPGSPAQKRGPLCPSPA